MITKVDPADWQHANVVQVDSDARDNMDAMNEVGDWAFERGFAIVPEYHLRPVLVGGRRRFRGICYRLTEEEAAGAMDDLAQIEETRRRIAEMQAQAQPR